MSFWLTRLCFQRSLGALYLIAFLIAANQFRALAGEHGLLPATLFVKQVKFIQAPGLFWFRVSDRWLAITAWLGVTLSACATLGLSERFGVGVSIAVWTALWLLYLSFVNAGQTFYGFGWETLLLETGFLAIFLGSRDTAAPVVVQWLLRWVLFRVMFGAGLIKMRGDACWRDLTCLDFHYETQPMPNPLSWFFHYQPGWMHKTEVLFTHFVELVVPWGYLIPGVTGYVAGAITIIFQLTLIFSGNLSWLNYITIVLCIPCFDDRALARLLSLQIPIGLELSRARKGALVTLAVLIIALSIKPAWNLIRPGQLMNASFEPLHLVNTYGAFGSVTRERMEVALEGTSDTTISPTSAWREYAFKGKPGDPMRMPPLISPYHLHLDWQMWFAAMSPYYNHPWILNLVAKLLKGDPQILALMGPNPFPKAPPHFVRAKLYLYKFTRPGEKGWWRRVLVDEYLPPLSLDDPRFREVLDRMGWS